FDRPPSPRGRGIDRDAGAAHRGAGDRGGNRVRRRSRHPAAIGDRAGAGISVGAADVRPRAGSERVARRHRYPLGRLTQTSLERCCSPRSAAYWGTGAMGTPVTREAVDRRIVRLEDQVSLYRAEVTRLTEREAAARRRADELQAEYQQVAEREVAAGQRIGHLS